MCSGRTIVTLHAASDATFDDTLPSSERISDGSRTGLTLDDLLDALERRSHRGVVALRAITRAGDVWGDRTQ